MKFVAKKRTGTMSLATITMCSNIMDLSQKGLMSINEKIKTLESSSMLVPHA